MLNRGSVSGLLLVLIALLALSLGYRSSEATNTPPAQPLTTQVGWSPVGSPTSTPSCTPGFALVTSPNGPALQNTLTGISAIASDDIWAVGSYNPNGARQTLAQHWDGSQWSIVPSPGSDGYSYFKGVAAVAHNDVWAVGTTSGVSNTGALIEHWDGSQWSIVASPPSDAILNAVTVISNTDVWAVGYYSSGGPAQTLTEHWNGAAWSIVASPNPGSKQNVFNGLSGSSSNDVWAVGYANDMTGTHALTEHWNGAAWSVVPSLSLPGDLAGSVALAPNDAWVVGSPTISPSAPITGHWDGSSWINVASSPLVGDFLGVAARASDDVWAVGSYPANSDVTLAAHWDGTQWSRVPSDYPGFQSELWQVAEIGPNDVWAVGDSGTMTGSIQTLTLHYSGPCATPTPTLTPLSTDTPAAPSPTPQPTICANPFVDIDTDIFFHAINYLYCGGVVNGTDATHYSPSATSTRGQFAKVVVLGFGLPTYTPTGGGQDFSDVPLTYFAYQYIEAGFHHAILSGFDAATCQAAGQVFPCYLPGQAITRGQLTKLVVGAAGYPSYTPGGGPDFSDVPPQSVFYVSIETAYHKGVVGGYPDHTFRPSLSIRRDEMAQIVFKGVTTP